MENKNKTILGLDLGTNSIGWALIEVDQTNKPLDIIAMGSRIIPLDSDDKIEFQKGQSISKNKKRTLARTQRKSFDRKQLKKSNDFKFSLKKCLEKLNIYPDEQLLKLPMLDLWKLRSDAASENENITPIQLGRILYMLNQKRGYKSARSEANADKKDTDYVSEIKGRHKQLIEKKLTVGQHFYNELLQANKNNLYFRVKEKVYPREAYIEEFDAIVNAQKGKHEFLTDEVINTLKNEIIYYQRKLKSQKHLVSICEYENFETTFIDKKTNQLKTKTTGPKVAPRSSPLFQLCKIWESTNNITLKIQNPDINKTKWIDRIPTIDEKRKIASYLSVNDNISYTELLKILDLKKEQVYSNKNLIKGIQGNKTFSELQKIIGNSEYLKFETKSICSKHPAILVDKSTGEILVELESEELDSTLENEPLYQLWHTIYSIKDIDECRNALKKRFGFNQEIADKLSKIDFNKQAYGNKSTKAIRKILPYLMSGFNLSDSECLAGYNRILTKAEKAKNIIEGPIALLPKNSLRQPVVEKILNQMINVVNAITENHGRPNEIRVELARELKQSKDEREETDKTNTNNKKLNDLVVNRLQELGLPTTKRYIQKYKFIFPSKDKDWKNAKVVNQCIYCGKSFNITEALSGDNFDIDHIVPKTLLFDDSQTNKVLVHRICNSQKTNQTAYDYISKKGTEELNQFLSRVDDWFKQGIISYGKMQRLKISFEEYQERKKEKKETEADKKIWETFIDRQLRETAYISKKAKQILEKISNSVYATEGTVTAKLRKIWGWDNVLMNLQMEKYKSVGQTQVKEWTSNHGKTTHKIEEISNWTKRDDHRHHAIDALTIACTQQSFIQRINTLSSSNVRDEMKKELDLDKFKYNEQLTLLENYILDKKPFDTKKVEQEAEKIYISFKSGKKVATLSKYKAKGKNKETGVIVPRGPLHEQFVYGKIKTIARNFKNNELLKFPVKYLIENIGLIADKKAKELLYDRISINNNDKKAAINSLKKDPIYLDNEKTKILADAYCFKEEFVIKYKLQDIKVKDVPFIVDNKVKEIIKERLDAFNGKEKEAFKDPLWFNESKKIPILTVRCFTGLEAIEAIKKDEMGKDIGFAKPGNNHHIAIYKNSLGKHIQHLCTFWHSVERRKYKIPIIANNTNTLWTDIINYEFPQSFLNKLPPDNLELQFSMQQNEMFILGLTNIEFETALKENNKPLISKHLYLVWSLSSNDYWFRHHLETKNSELKNIDGASESLRYFRFKSIGSLLSKNPIKVRINHIGEITKIGE